MNYDQQFINDLINDEINISDKISSLYHYPSNITHLLYIIIPAFIIKYGLNNKQLIEKVFLDIPIIIKDKQDKVYQAYYFSLPILDFDKIITKKGIVLSNYEDIGLMQLLDNLIHEFNHAINSIKNEIIIQNDILIRTGISYNIFNKKDLKFIGKSDEIILEEVINTKQTELIVDIIKNFSNYTIDNSIVNSTLYSIYHSIDSNYHSNSYLLESTVCSKLLENKTFLSTIEKLRFDGQVSEFSYFFDDVVGKEGSLLELSRLLNKSLELQKELLNVKWFKNKKINSINELNKKAMKIVDVFNQNTIYK